MNYYGYNGYGNYGYPQQNFYSPPMQDQLLQLRNNNQFQQPVQNSFPNQPLLHSRMSLWAVTSIFLNRPTLATRGLSCTDRAAVFSL